MSLIDFQQVKDELMDGEVEGINVLVRPAVWSARNQVPAALFLTKDALFYGGCKATEGMFHRIPFKSMNNVSIAGKWIFRCIRLDYVGLEGDKKIFFCPFAGEPHRPSIDVEKLNKLHELISNSIK